MFHSLIYSNIVRIIQVSKFKEVRKLALRNIKIPQYLNSELNQDDEIYDDKIKIKTALIKCFGMRLMD